MTQRQKLISVPESEKSLFGKRRLWYNTGSDNRRRQNIDDTLFRSLPVRAGERAGGGDPPDGREEVTVLDGRVDFSGGSELLARGNLWLRTAERLFVKLGEFPARSFEELFQGVKGLPLEDWIGRQDAFPVKGHCVRSALHSVPDCQKIVKKAAVERLKEKYGGQLV